LAEWNTNTIHPSSLAYFSGIKYVIDGTPLEQNSLNKKPYGENGNWYGRLDYPVDTIRQILKEALVSDRQLMMHIVGDSTTAVVLSLMKQLAGGSVWKSKRVRFEHNSTSNITASEINDVRELGLLMMHTPKYGRSSRIRSLMEKGVTVGISPDGTTNPFWDIMVITSQQTNPAENITREQAVIAYTKTNAFAECKEKEKGTLTKGMLADLAVLSQDIFTVPTEQLPATQSVLTIVDGKIVYQQPIWK
jgi:predicted amidohydrolase YtcJ